MRKKQNGSNHNVELSMEYFFENNRFFYLLKQTEKYKDLYKSKEAFVSLVLSIITTIILLVIAQDISSIDQIKFFFSRPFSQNSVENTVNLIRNLLTTNIAGLFGLLGFVIGGLSILSGTISVKVIDSINDEGKIKHLMRIMFSFYYIGALIGITLVVSFFTYMITYVPLKMDNLILMVWSSIIAYFSYFTIISSVMLLGTSLRFFILNYWYYLREKGKNNN